MPADDQRRNVLRRKKGGVCSCVRRFEVHLRINLRRDRPNGRMYPAPLVPCPRRQASGLCLSGKTSQPKSCREEFILRTSEARQPPDSTHIPFQRVKRLPVHTASVLAPQSLLRGRSSARCAALQNRAVRPSAKAHPHHLLALVSHILLLLLSTSTRTTPTHHGPPQD